jgi:outer membrane lipoprotein carrier protein
MAAGILGVCMVLLFGVFDKPLAAEGTAELLKGVQEKYGSLPGFTVAYSREILSKSMAMLGEPVKTDDASGLIHFKPPHFLRIAQEKPRQETVLADGRTLWWYIPHKKQVYRYPSSKLGRELTLLVDIFQGLKRAEETFRIAREEPLNQGEAFISLTPEPPWPQVEHIGLSIDPGDHRIRVVEIHNHIGGVTRFILGALTVMERFSDGFFFFEVPEGVRIIDESGQ